MGDRLITDERIAVLMGYKPHQTGMARRKLEDQGVHPFPGRAGRWFITIDQLNAARGIVQAAANTDDLL